MDKEIVPIIIDLNAAANGEMNESFLEMFGGAIEMLLGKMFGYNSNPVILRGTNKQIKNFAGVLNGEKKYMDAYEKYGLSDPKTYSSKHSLDKAIAKFEKSTGIKYPIK